MDLHGVFAPRNGYEIGFKTLAAIRFAHKRLDPLDATFERQEPVDPNVSALYIAANKD
jgi:hypothetical protein